MISLVIPTYNEAAVIQEALRRASASLRKSGEGFEIIVVDDASSDGTAEQAEALRGELPVRVLRRSGRFGLATAVRDGWAVAGGDLLGVMDADLQHPPEILGSLVDALRTPGVDVAIASRKVVGGGTFDWSWRRRFISWGATHLAASVLPWSLAAVNDPMSGMFLVRAAALQGVQLDPIGYKILVEILAKAQYRELVEVPYIFEQRRAGSSKLGAQQSLEFLLHLARLASSTGQLRAWIRYGVVGLSGAAVNLAALYFLTQQAGWPRSLAVPLAVQIALLSNFFGNHTLTFRSRRANEGGGPRVINRFLRYEKVCALGAVLNAVVTLLLAGYGVQLLLAAAVGMLSGSLWNVLFSLPAIWRVWGARSSQG